MSEQSSHQKDVQTAQAPAEWLLERIESIDITEAARCELRHMRLPQGQAEVLLSRIGHSFLEKWGNFVAHLQPDDQLWYFRSPVDAWNDFSGRSGVAIVRDGTPISSIILSWS